MKEWDQGPNTLYPAKSLTTTKLDEGVTLRISEDAVKIKTQSIYTKFQTVVDEIPMYPALAYKLKEKWIYINYAEYWKLCNKAAKSFIKVKFYFIFK